MRSSRLFAHDPQGMIPRMSWSPHNLYNLIARSMPLYASGASFQKTRMTMYQQRWRSKRLLRGYHGDWIRETNFKRWFLPTDLPQLRNTVTRRTSIGRETSGEERMPVSSLFLRDVERRLDTIVFRCCFARSAREARALVVQGKVQLNGQMVKLPGTLVNPGDLISVEPESIPLLSKELQKQMEIRQAAKLAAGQEIETIDEAEDTTAAEEESSETIAEERSEETAENSEGVSTLESADESPAAIQASKAITADDSSATKAIDEVETTKRAIEKSKNRSKKTRQKEELAPGVLPFNLPPYAAPFLFIPPFLEVSFNTCSAIYLRHPTITPIKTLPTTPRSRRSAEATVLYNTDMPSPYPAGGEIYSLAWEHYIKNSPRTRSDLRRLQLDAQVGRDGFKSARAKDQYKKVRAVRRGHDKAPSSNLRSPIVKLAERARRRKYPSQYILEKGEARGKVATLRA